MSRLQFSRSPLWDDPRNELLAHYVRLLQGLRPRWFMLENVEGLLTADRGRYMYELVKGFLATGYNLRLHKLYSHWYGLPQERKRVFLLGTTDYEDFEFPQATHAEHQTFFEQNPCLSIMDAISDLPVPGSTIHAEPAYTTQAYTTYQQTLRGNIIRDHWSSSLSAETQARIEALHAGQTMKDLPEQLQHASFQRRAKRRVMDGTPTEKRGGAPAGLKRLQASKPSLTITSAAIREFVHPTEDRFLTLRECARIQSFPDDFRFIGFTSTIIQMIGNAIPPLIAELLARHIIGIEHTRPRGKKITYGTLQGYFLTKAASMSPALARTASLLHTLQNAREQAIHLQAT